MVNLVFEPGSKRRESPDGNTLQDDNVENLAKTCVDVNDGGNRIGDIQQDYTYVATSSIVEDLNVFATRTGEANATLHGNTDTYIRDDMLNRILATLRKRKLLNNHLNSNMSSCSPAGSLYSGMKSVQTSLPTPTYHAEMVTYFATSLTSQ